MNSYVAPLGDIDGNGIVDSVDLTALRYYLCGIRVAVVKERLDVNGDGAVNMRDVAQLAQCLASVDGMDAEKNTVGFIDS